MAEGVVPERKLTAGDQRLDPFCLRLPRRAIGAIGKEGCGRAGLLENVKNLRNAGSAGSVVEGQRDLAAGGRSLADYFSFAGNRVGNLLWRWAGRFWR